MKYFILVVCFALIAVSAFSMPMSPELEQLLKENGTFDPVVTILKEARLKGVDAPNPYRLELTDSEQTTLYGIVLLADFSDNVATTDTLHFDSLLSYLGTYPTGSFRDYFLEVSYNHADIILDVAGWFRMPQTYAYYVNGQYGFGNYPQNAQRLTEDAVWVADPVVDFSQYDNDNDGYIDALFVVHAGPGAEETGDPNDIWSHAWVTYNVPYVDGVYAYAYSQEPENGRIGVFCHEAGHSLFGLPDLYDYDYDSRGTGMWSLMSFGSWGNNGRRPVHMDAWSKIQCGFATPVVPTQNQINVAFPDVEFNPHIYKLWTHGAPANEFFMVENRQVIGFDNYLPAGGMLIYHVDENQSNNNNQWYPGYTNFGHYLVAVEQADGDWDLERNINSGDGGDPYPGSTVNRFFNDGSTPDSKDYNFSGTLVGVENITDSDDTMYADIYVTYVGVEEYTPENKETLQLSVYPSISRSSVRIAFIPSKNDSEFRLEIYDLNGRIVRAIDQLPIEKHGRVTIIWEGLDDRGKPVSSGVYFLKLSFFSKAFQRRIDDVQRISIIR